MYRRWHRKVQFAYGLLDAGVILLAFWVAYETRWWINRNPAFPSIEYYFEILPGDRMLLVGFSIAAWLLAARWLRIWDDVHTGRYRSIAAGAIKQSAAAVVALVLFQFVLRLDLSRLFLGLFGAYAALLLFWARVPMARVLDWIELRSGSVRQIFIAGTGPHALRMAGTLTGRGSRGVRLTGFLAARNPAPKEIEVGGAAYPVHALSGLSRLLEDHVVDEIIFAVDSRDLAELEDVFLLCDEEGVRTRLALDFFPHVNSRVYLDHFNATPLLTFSAAPDDELHLLAKRAVDLIGALLGLAVLGPAMLAVTAAIRLSSPGPAIFRQVRCGLNGRRFVLYKFRSMVWNAEELKASVIHLNDKTTAFKIRRDPRLTPLGRFLRKYSIDEWPQLWNVIKGDMSLVGPRPAVPEEVEKYERWQRRRLRMRPGLTCLWTLAGRDMVDFPTWMKLDLQYIDNWSLRQDVRIILRTIPYVLTGRGAY